METETINPQAPLTQAPEHPRDIKWIVIHCSATRSDQHYGIEQLRRDHIGHNHWSDIGYHYYITRDGMLWPCRPEDKIGAHVKGYNTNSIGVCYEGGYLPDGTPADTRTDAQRKTMAQLLSELKQRYPAAMICGHRDLLKRRTKLCPCFEAREYYKYMK